MLVRVDGFDAIADGDQVDASRPGGDGEQAPLGEKARSHGASDAQVERAGSGGTRPGACGCWRR